MSRRNKAADRVVYRSSATAGLSRETRSGDVAHDIERASGGAYALVGEGARLRARVRSRLGLPPSEVSFRRLQGRLHYDASAWARSHVRLRVDPSAVAADPLAFNLQVVDFFLADRHPAIEFVSRAFIADAGRLSRVDGDLTLRGVTRPISLRVRWGGRRGLPARLGFSGATRIRRSDFGMTEFLQYAADEVDLAFAVEFEKL